MTVRKTKMCKCGHAASFHPITIGKKQRGPCEACGGRCEGFRRRTSALDVDMDITDPQSLLNARVPVREAVGVTAAVSALDAIIEGFQSLRKALVTMGTTGSLFAASESASPSSRRPSKMTLTKMLPKAEPAAKTRAPAKVTKHLEGDADRLPPGAQRLIDVLASYPEGQLTKTRLGTLAVMPAKKGTCRSREALRDRSYARHVALVLRQAEVVRAFGASRRHGRSRRGAGSGEGEVR